MKKRTQHSLFPSAYILRTTLTVVMLTTFLIISLMPSGASLLRTGVDEKSLIPTEPTGSTTEPTVVETSPDVVVKDETQSTEPTELSSEEESESPVIEPVDDPTDATVEHTELTESETQSSPTTNDSQTYIIMNDGTPNDISSEGDTESSLNPAIQEVALSITTSSDASTTTSINTINVVTTQQIIDVSAEISITKDAPHKIPSLTLENQKEFIGSYVTVHLLADNDQLLANEIESMMVTFKIKKDQQNQTAQNENQIYVLTSCSDPLFELSHPFIQTVVSSTSFGIWQPLTPVEVTEDEEYLYYHVETPSYFATFAIVGTDLVEIQPYQSGIPEIPWVVIIVTIIFSTTLLLVVLFKTGFIYQIEEPAERKNKEKSFTMVNQKWSYKVKLTTTPPEMQLLRSPTLYFASVPQSPHVITASAQKQESPEILEEDPMYL